MNLKHEGMDLNPYNKFQLYCELYKSALSGYCGASNYQVEPEIIALKSKEVADEALKLLVE